MRILLLGPAFAPVVAAHSERIVALARLLRQDGHSVRVITLDTKLSDAARDYDPLQFADGISVVNTGVHRRLKRGGATKFLRLALDCIAAMPGPYIFEARRMLSQALRQCELHDADLVWVSTPPHELQLVGYWLSRRLRIPYVMDLRDPWGESIRIRWLTPWQKRSAQRWYRRCLEQAAGVITNTAGHKSLLLEAHPDIADKKVFCVPNGYFESDVQVALTAEHAGNSPLVLMYAGSLYGGAVESALAALVVAARACKDPIEARLLGAESGSYPLTYCGRVPPSEVIQEVVSARWLFLYMPDDAANVPVMSLKAYIYARSGKPIIYKGPRNDTYSYLRKHTQLIEYTDAAETVAQMRAAAPIVTPVESAIVSAASWEARQPAIDRILELCAEFPKADA